MPPVWRLIKVGFRISNASLGRVIIQIALIIQIDQRRLPLASDDDCGSASLCEHGVVLSICAGVFVAAIGPQPLNTITANRTNTIEPQLTITNPHGDT